MTSDKKARRFENILIVFQKRTSMRCAANVSLEPFLPIFCIAAIVCYHGVGKKVQQRLGF
jgi:hypothetical protein